MGSSYQTILAAGTHAEIQEVLASAGKVAIVVAVAEDRWAVVPQEDDGGYADTDELAIRLSALPGGLAAGFQVHDSDALTAQLFRGGREYHRYLSDQSVLMEWWDDDDNEIWVNLDGEPWMGEGKPPATAAGDDPDTFAPLGFGQIDLETLQRALSGKQTFAEQQHCAILTALNLNPEPLTAAYRHQAPASSP